MKKIIALSLIPSLAFAQDRGGIGYDSMGGDDSGGLLFIIAAWIIILIVGSVSYFSSSIKDQKSQKIERSIRKKNLPTAKTTIASSQNNSYKKEIAELFWKESKLINKAKDGFNFDVLEKNQWIVDCVCKDCHGFGDLSSFGGYKINALNAWHEWQNKIAEGFKPENVYESINYRKFPFSETCPRCLGYFIGFNFSGFAGNAPLKFTAVRNFLGIPGALGVGGGLPSMAIKFCNLLRNDRLDFQRNCDYCIYGDNHPNYSICYFYSAEEYKSNPDLPIGFRESVLISDGKVYSFYSYPDAGDEIENRFYTFKWSSKFQTSLANSLRLPDMYLINSINTFLNK